MCTELDIMQMGKKTCLVSCSLVDKLNQSRHGNVRVVGVLRKHEIASDFNPARDASDH